MNNFYAIATISTIVGYLFGSIPFGLVITKMAGLGDIRKIGSGNIGATNVLRTGRKDLALITLLLDSGKAAIAYGFGYYIATKFVNQEALLSFIPVLGTALLAGFGAIIGHNFPIWLKFKGGKGVASTIGFLFASSWPCGLAVGLTWLATAFTFKYSSLAALISLSLAPLYAYFFASTAHVVTYALLAVLSIIRHRANIARLIKGEESKIKVKKDK